MVDDTPYGGGAGMVLKAEPVLRAIDALRDTCPQSTDAPMRILIPSPQGRPLTHQLAEELKDEPRRIVFVCGHYEGFDERVRMGLDAEEVSIGDYVLTNGELPALVILDAAVRLIPGVLGDPDSFPTGLVRRSAVGSSTLHPAAGCAWHGRPGRAFVGRS